MVRMFVAIGTLCIAAVLLVFGFAFKFFSGSVDATQSVPISSTSSYAVIDADVLRTHPGAQIVVLAAPGMNTVAYGATADVTSWLAGSPYVHVSLKPKSTALSVSEVSTVESTKANTTAAASNNSSIVSPAGSDMWLGEATNPQGAASLRMQLHDGESVIVATDGTKPLPSEISLVWPKPKQTFLGMTDDVLIIVGGVILLAGILLYLWALNKMRGGKGPRRRGRLPKAPKPNQRIGRGPRRAFGSTTGRRAVGRTSFVALAIAGALTVSLAGCSTVGAESVNPTPTPTPTAGSAPAGPPPVVTSEQMDLILAKVIATMKFADNKNDSTSIRDRFTAAALDARLARYAMRKSNAKITALPGITAKPIQLLLPQATSLWPRSVIAVVKADSTTETGKEPPSVAVVMTQDSPRSNYKVAYLSNLQPKQKTPQVASAQDGAPLVALDTSLLSVRPLDLAATYADVVMNGQKSKNFVLFDAATDQLRQALMAERKQQQGADIGATFQDVAGAATPVSFATVDGGALVAVQMNELGTYAAQNNKDLKLSGQLQALAGMQISAKPATGTYGFQLLFFVPAADAHQKIQLLGYVENLIGVSFAK